MSVVVGGLEEHVRLGRDRKWLLVEVDPQGERTVRMPVGADPGEELAADLESRLTVGRRLLGFR